MQIGGRGGIRTHDTLAGIPVFETGRFNHSRTLPILILRNMLEILCQAKLDQRQFLEMILAS